MIISLLAAIGGIALTTVQILLIYMRESGLCLDEGCRVVDSMTTIGPLYVNLIGLAFFLVISFGLLRARSGSEGWKQLTGLLLLCALAAEGVLISFQHFVALTYCSYCLIVFSLIVTANVFLGLRQLFRGMMIFGSIILTFTGLDFSSGASPPSSLDEGTLARFESAGAERHFTLFFSSDCTHCETVLGEMDSAKNCTISFNPIDTITRFTFPGATFTNSYRPKVNRDFLKRLDIDTIPVLLEKDANRLTLVKGESAIRAFLLEQCQEPVPATALPDIGTTLQSPATTAWQLPTTEDGCSIDENCDPPSAPEVIESTPAPPTP